MIPTRFSVACHALVLIAEAGAPLTSSTLAERLGVAAVPLRRLMMLLKQRRLVASGKAGPSSGRGYRLTLAPRAIVLAMVWEAVHPPRERLIRLHDTDDLPFLEAMTAMTRAAESRLKETFVNTTVHDLLEARKRS